jgi:pyruvate/2-oxoglutarate dehydrogenase complex dihydrolipoamide acyltransferase (E2) component
VKRTGSAEDVGILRFDFPGYSGQDTLESITWEQFFQKLDERNLALLYEEETSGGQKSNFNKIVSAETTAPAKRPARSPRAVSKKSAVKKPLPPAAKKAAANKGVTKKAAAKKGATKKGATKKAGMKKVARKKTAARKTTGRKAAVRKGVTKKKPAKKSRLRGRR